MWRQLFLSFATMSLTCLPAYAEVSHHCPIWPCYEDPPGSGIWIMYCDGMSIDDTTGECLFEEATTHPAVADDIVWPYENCPEDCFAQRKPPVHKKKFPGYPKPHWTKDKPGDLTFDHKEADKKFGKAVAPTVQGMKKFIKAEIDGTDRYFRIFQTKIPKGLMKKSPNKKRYRLFALELEGKEPPADHHVIDPKKDLHSIPGQDKIWRATIQLKETEQVILFLKNP